MTHIRNSKTVKVLLVGGEGFIGSNFIKKFNSEFDFIVISSKKKKLKKLLK